MMNINRLTAHAAWPRPRQGVGDLLVDRWLLLWVGALAGYAMCGRGFAYVGLPPLFVGEFVLMTGLMVLLMSRGLFPVMNQPVTWAIVALASWSLMRTLPYIGDYGFSALRDAVIWGYAAFALIVASVLIASPNRLAWLINLYRRFAKMFLIVAPIAWLLTFFAGDAVPRWPWADVPIIHAKTGDLNVHLAGIAVFWIVGFAGATHRLWLAMLLMMVPAAGMKNRGGLVSFVLACMIAVCARPKSRWASRMAWAAVIGLTIFALTDLHIPMSGQKRDISFQQLMSNVMSVTGQTRTNALEGTKEWRLHWWRDIVDYTFNGPYFWMGKGFGINLANDDGYQVNADESLRSPHNGHLTMLARAGVPGLALWLTVHAGWAIMIFNGYLISHRGRDPAWSALYIFLLAFWSAFMVNTCFDVFIEGPMGGIWFWSIVGVGIAARWIHRHYPEVLYEDANPRRA